MLRTLPWVVGETGRQHASSLWWYREVSIGREEYRIIPALVALIGRLSRRHDVQVFALRQEAQPCDWQLAGAHIHNIGFRLTRTRGNSCHSRHARCVPIRSRPRNMVRGRAASLRLPWPVCLRIPCLVHVAGGELVALPEIGYGGALTWRGRVRERFDSSNGIRSFGGECARRRGNSRTGSDRAASAARCRSDRVAAARTGAPRSWRACETDPCCELEPYQRPAGNYPILSRPIDTSRYTRATRMLPASFPDYPCRVAQHTICDRPDKAFPYLCFRRP